MNPGRYFMPNFGIRPTPYWTPIIGENRFIPRNVGLFSKTINGLKTFNWKGLIRGASKTLNVVNQTIPLIRQAGPMVSNVKGMLQIARAFKKETNNSHVVNYANNKIMARTHSTNDYKKREDDLLNRRVDNTPTFFI